MSELYSLVGTDYAKGMVVAMFGGAITLLAQLASVPGFQFTDISWAEVARVAVAAGLAYLAKNFVSDGNGKVLGRIG